MCDLRVQKHTYSHRNLQELVHFCKNKNASVYEAEKRIGIIMLITGTRSLYLKSSEVLFKFCHFGLKKVAQNELHVVPLSLNILLGIFLLIF